MEFGQLNDHELADRGLLLNVRLSRLSVIEHMEEAEGMTADQRSVAQKQSDVYILAGHGPFGQANRRLSAVQHRCSLGV